MQVQDNINDKINQYKKIQNEILNYIKDLILNNNDNINATNDKGNTILHWACTYDLLDVAEYLIDIGTDVNKHNKNGYTPLHLAHANGNLELIDLLEKNGANQNATDNIGREPLQHFISYLLGETLNCIKYEI